jgi:hypothetical protein
MSSTNEPQSVDVNGRALRCVICSNQTFWSQTAMLNKSASTFFGLDWADRNATCFICAECTYIHWFFGQGPRMV